MDSKRWALVIACCGALFFLYFFGLTRAGVIGPDEPRYAAIGQAMAASGDWVTPRLWGSAWFEKPALLYWMTAAGFKAGWGLDLAPRLPVALLSAAFLVYFFFALRREFGERAAFFASAILATSAGWLAYSHSAITDIPMSICFAAAMLAALRIEPGNFRFCAVAGVLLGAAILAKGLVPVVLFVPAFWFLRRNVSGILTIAGMAALIALPWYGLVTLRNGHAFLDEFFWRQQFGRFVSGALQHERPIWYYVPVFVAGFFPWSPLIVLLFSRRLYADRRTAFLLGWLAWGFLFFSISRNKLPGYLLPLLPAGAALLGIAIASMEARSWKLVALFALSAELLGFIPVVQDLLPQALLMGITRAHIHFAEFWIFPAILLAGSCALLEWRGYRGAAISVVAVAITLSVVRLIWQVYPVLDRTASPRSFWGAQNETVTCIPAPYRSWRYGLDYYSGQDLPDCN